MLWNGCDAAFGTGSYRTAKIACRDVQTLRFVQAFLWSTFVQTSLQETAEKARGWATETTALPLAGAKCFFMHGGSGRVSSERVRSLTAIVVKLGAQVSPARSCTICIVCHSDGAASCGVGSWRLPRTLGAQVPVVSDEWLLSTAELGCAQAFAKFSAQ